MCDHARMAEISKIVLNRPDGTPQPLSAYAGRPTIIQTVRYFA